MLLAGGGSGGSATPLLAVADALRARHPGVAMLYVGTRTGPESSLARAAGLNYAAVSSGKLRRYWSVANVTDVGRVVAGVAQAAGHLRRFRPTVALGAGGFASVPPLVAARLLGVPVMIHQQDVVPGLANRLLVPCARWISVALPETLPRFPRSRTRLRGNPVRASILAADPARAAELLDLEPGLPFVLVTGGGTGALRLNQIVADAASSLVRFCQVLHLTGRGRAVPAPWLGPRYRQEEFLVEGMAAALAAADLVVCRAGLGTIAELSALGKPSIVVPMPASHQLANAWALESRSAAIVLREETLAPAALAEHVRDLLADERRRRALGCAMASVMPHDAAARLADDVAALSKGLPRPD